MRRLTFWAAGCRPSLLLWMLVLVAATAVSAYAQDVTTNAVAPGSVVVDPFLAQLAQLPWPAVVAALGWRALGLVERGLVMAESCWLHVQRDGIPKVSVSHVVNNKPERHRDSDEDEDTRS